VRGQLNGYWKTEKSGVMKQFDIVVDFDGTCTAHDFPRVGQDIGAQKVLRKLVAKGHRLILFTMRSNMKDITVDMTKVEKGFIPVEGDYLDDAVQWFKDNDIPLYGIQVNPTQSTWTSSPKAYGQYIIDDAAVGCPTIYDPKISHRPFVDWSVMELLLKDLIE